MFTVNMSWCLMTVFWFLLQKDLPSLCLDTHVYAWPQDYEAIIYRLFKKEKYIQPKVGPPPKCTVETYDSYDVKLQSAQVNNPNYRWGVPHPHDKLQEAYNRNLQIYTFKRSIATTYFAFKRLSAVATVDQLPRLTGSNIVEWYFHCIEVFEQLFFLSHEDFLNPFTLLRCIFVLFYRILLYRYTQW